MCHCLVSTPALVQKERSEQRRRSADHWSDPTASLADLLSQNSFSINILTNSRTATKNATIDDQRQQAVLLTVTSLIVVVSPNA
jgi:hypothetical protein